MPASGASTTRLGIVRPPSVQLSWRERIRVNGRRTVAAMGELRAADLDVERIGEGPPIVLVHGSIVGPQQTWRAQYELAARWTLILPHRPGFGASPPLARGDFAAEAPL